MLLRFDEDGCRVNDDDLYDEEEYESANFDLSSADPDTILLNGKPVRFSNKKTPFEM